MKNITVQIEKPFKYFLIHKESKEVKVFIGYQGPPIKSDLCKWVGDEFKQVWDAYEDKRYYSKVRLFNFINKSLGKGSI